MSMSSPLPENETPSTGKMSSTESVSDLDPDLQVLRSALRRKVVKDGELLELFEIALEPTKWSQLEYPQVQALYEREWVDPMWAREILGWDEMAPFPKEEEELPDGHYRVWMGNESYVRRLDLPAEKESSHRGLEDVRNIQVIRNANNETDLVEIQRVKSATGDLPIRLLLPSAKDGTEAEWRYQPTAMSQNQPSMDSANREYTHGCSPSIPGTTSPNTLMSWVPSSYLTNSDSSVQETGPENSSG